MSVSAIIVTRGDVDLKPVLRSLPEKWEVIVYDNGPGAVFVRVLEASLARKITGEGELPDLSVYGRYAAIEYASNDLIYVQDDDCVVSDPGAIVGTWNATRANDPTALLACHIDDFEAVVRGEHVVCNMPPEFRAQDFYAEHALVGFGACFHRDAPAKAFARYEYDIGGSDVSVLAMDKEKREVFYRTCDIVFTALTPRILVDVPYSNLPWASADNRMWKQPSHREERGRMLDLVLQVRDNH